ncbi:ABC transporter substrate-binding protein [Bradyrhizobium sp. 139]|uniref:ABC transporter substrate-binding protein n=1 Tax=Bradyrhizobium sp. 139 TaxID=2782616 RepID=UPI0031FE7D32
MLVGGGDVGKAYIEAYVRPFQAETGIKVIAITDQISLAKFDLMVTTKSVSVDVASMNQGSALVAAGKDLLEQIDYSIYSKGELDGLFDFAKQPFGVGMVIYSYLMVYNTEKFPANKPRPTNWAEFWDVKTFPGIRALVSGRNGAEGPWEEALLAEGVSPDKIYPMDIDRVFASLDRIKPHIRKWWTVGSEIQQIMQDKAADLVQSYSGRAGVAISRGAPMELNRNQSKLQWDYWVIPKGSPNAQNAQRFIEFTARAERQAAFARLFPEGPTNQNAFKFLPQDLARKLPTHPDYMANAIPINMQWYSERGSGGLTNAERLRERWNEWVLR